MNQSLNHYYIFYTVATYRNFSTAARNLFISQPAVSKAVSKLEDELSTQLFHRTTKGVFLTDAGEILYKQLQIAFHAIESGEEQIRKSETLDAEKLSIGTSSTLCKYVLLPYLRKFIPENPHVKISISCINGPEIIEGLNDGSLDFGIMGETDKVPFHTIRNINNAFVCTLPYLNKLRRQAYTSDKPFMADSDLFAFGTLLLLTPNNLTRQYLDRYMEANQLSAGQIIEMTSMDLLIEFAKTGLGIAWVIRDYVEKELEEGTLVLLSTRVPIPSRKIGITYSSNATMSRPMERFLQGFHM